MTSFLQDNDDLRFYIDKAIDWQSLVEVTERGFIDADQGGFSTTANGSQRSTTARTAEWIQGVFRVSQNCA